MADEEILSTSENAPPPAAEHEAFQSAGSQTGGNSNPDDAEPALKHPAQDGVSAPISVVGIGASAGGVQVLQEFFGEMPTDTGLAFVVVMHLSPEHESNLAEILQRTTEMRVRQVNEPVKVEPNCVYVIPPDKNLMMRDSMIVVGEGQRSEGRRVAIDLFFRTLAEQYGQRCACIVLSGTDSDGVIGLKHIKAQGGVTIAQEPSEAEHSSMPRSAIDTGMVDWVLPVHEMPKRLAGFARNELAMTLPAEKDDSLPTLPDMAARGPGGPLVAKRTDAEEDESALHRVLTLLRTQTGHDFTHYKRATVLRRIARRLQVNQLETIPAYLEFLRTHPGEPRALLNDLLIGVTHFFRDQSAWRVLEAHIPQLFAGKTSADQLRVWVPGCATGEEAYSIAIVLLEHSFRVQNAPQLQIFATDLDDDAVRYARDGLYPRTIEADVSQERLRRFFFQQHGRYRIRKEVRELVLFADHNMLRDSPFSKLDLVTCRNLLIYLKPDAQHRVMDIFHFALRPGGLLFLGGSENLDDNHALFSPLDKKYRLFVRRAVPRLPIVSLVPFSPRTVAVPKLATPHIEQEFLPPEEREDAAELDKQTAERGAIASIPQVRFESLGELHLKLLEATSPPSLIVDEHHDILHMSANAGDYLHFSAGELSANLLRLVEEGVRLELRTALFRAAQTGETITVQNVTVHRDGEARSVNLQVRPAALSPDALGRAAGDSENFFVVIFEDAGAAPAETISAPQPHDSVTIHLENEIRNLRTQLNATVQQYEASTEELKASNEELQAMNEELRSATEELETSREELQSINEELTTVNAELKSNLDELGRANSDLQNLMASTEIGTVFLDRELHIKRFTPRVQELFNVLPNDVGRPLSDITTNIHYPQLETDARRVLTDLTRVERELEVPHGGWFIARMLPYRTLEDKIDGVVLTFVDITERRKAESELRARNDELERFNKTAVGRELRMVELKKEINALLAQLKQPAKYKIPNGDA